MSAKNKILKDGLTNKQRILQMVQRWDDDFRSQTLCIICDDEGRMQGSREAEAGLGRDHDEVFDELERQCDEEEKVPNALQNLQDLRRRIIQAGSPRTAMAYIKRLRKSVSRLRDFPELGAVIEGALVRHTRNSVRHLSSPLPI